MKISSTFHAQPGKVQFLVLDAVADGKPFYAGILISDLRANPPTCTDVGNECMRRLAAAQDQNSNADEVMLVEIRSPERAMERVPQVAERISRHGAAAFFCVDEDCYEAVFQAMNVGAKR